MKKGKQKRTHNWAKLTLELFVVFAGVTAGFLLNNWWNSASIKTCKQIITNVLLLI